MITADKYEQGEGTIISVSSTGDNDGTYTLVEGATAKGQTIDKILITIPGVTGDVYVTFYDDTPATTKLKGPFPLAAQPPEGFLIKKSVSSGKLGYRISGATNPTKKAYLTVTYSK